MRWLMVPLVVALAGCATLHHAQLDEIDASRGHLTPFSIHVSAVGVNARNAGRVASSLSRSKTPSKAAEVVEMFQFGPKTGNVVYNEAFPDSIAERIHERCPSGRVTGLVSTRETDDYYVASDENVVIRGFCIGE